MRRRTPARELRASLRPFGLGLQRPNNYAEVLRAIWATRRRPRYAWRILRGGVCDGCALGTAGMRDWTLDGVHLCNVRLRLLPLNTLEPFDPAVLEDVEGLARRSSAELRALGRLPAPMLRRAGESGFREVGWDEALDLVATRIAATAPERLGLYLTSRGTANETYYAAQKAARALGCASIDNAARVCHAPSTVTLKQTIGEGATTCSYVDWMEADWIVFVGSNPANNQPVAMKYLHHAKAHGARVAVVNPYREPGMERYWVPSIPSSALFGTRIADAFFEVDVGGDEHFLTGVLKHMVEAELVDRAWVSAHTRGFEETEAAVRALDWEQLERGAGLPRAEMQRLGELLGRSERVVLVWSMGITQHAEAEAGVAAIVNLALSRGFVGRDGCGLMPIRGHSGVQGGAEMGAYATALPGGVPVTLENAERLSAVWGFPIPAEPGLTTAEMLDAAARDELDVLIASGGNFVEVMPDPGAAREALSRVPLRVHLDIVLSSQMLLEPREDVLLLPATTRYEVPGGVTETSTERRVILSPEIPGPRVKEARPEWWALCEIAARARPQIADRIRFPGGTEEIRKEIAAVVPGYEPIAELRDGGESFQYGGRHLCPDGRFPMPEGRAVFLAPHPRERAPLEGRLRLVTRRGKQFNSIVQESKDAITGARRDDVLVASADVRRLGMSEGQPVVVRSAHGSLEARVRIAPVKPGTAQVHWPEGNVLIAGDVRSAEAKIPAYEALVELEPR